MSLSYSQRPTRGMLVNLATLPPLMYTFQYNPTQITDSKSVTWKTRKPVCIKDQSSASLMTQIEARIDAVGRQFSAADFKQFEQEGDREISFKLTIDGRELRPGEPKQRREADGNILKDLAVLRSFVYPQILDLLDLGKTSSAAANESQACCGLHSNDPPTAFLVLGSLTMEGYVSRLNITETQFNQNLDPVRADVDITLIEKVDSLTFIADAMQRIYRSFATSMASPLG